MAEHELLSQKTTRELIARFQAGDNEAAETLVQANTALVRSIVKRFLNRSIEYEDLFQIGCMGLVKAISRFDLSYDVRFSTYAVPMIAGEIKRFLRDDGMIKVSRSLKELAARAASAREKLSDKLGREASINEIAKELCVEPEDVAEAMEAARPYSSIYEPAYGADSDALLVGSCRELESAVDRVALKELLSTLSPRERTIITLRYFSDKTQSQVAAVLGISQVQVSRLENTILLRLRKLL
jgi:RNA polymerase sporulation-specific sigma factor